MAGIDATPRTSGIEPGVELDPIQLVAPDGTPTAESRYRRDLPPETLAWLYESMVVTRELDIEFVNLQRQGELALFAPSPPQDPLVEELKQTLADLRPDELTPKAALDVLYGLCEIARRASQPVDG